MGGTRSRSLYSDTLCRYAQDFNVPIRHRFLRTTFDAGTYASFRMSPFARTNRNGLDFADSLLGLLRVLNKLADRLTSILVINHFGEELRRNGDDVGTGKGGALDIEERPDASDD